MKELKPAHQETPLMACLLIGGHSSRMGRPKHLIKGVNGKTWVENTVNLLQPFTQDIVLSGRGDVSKSLESVTRIPDVPDVQGPLTGILAAMRWQPESCCSPVICQISPQNPLSGCLPPEVPALLGNCATFKR